MPSMLQLTAVSIMSGDGFPISDSIKLRVVFKKEEDVYYELSDSNGPTGVPDEKSSSDPSDASTAFLSLPDAEAAGIKVCHPHKGPISSPG